MDATPHRKRLVPRSVVIAASVVVGLLVLAGIAVWLIADAQAAVVPNVVGVTQEQAAQNLGFAGLKAEVGGTQVSVDVPEGSVVSQSLPPGTETRTGTVVVLVISAGRQTYAVPDLVGTPLADARDALMALGLNVTVETVSSTATETTVLEMYPSPAPWWLPVTMSASRSLARPSRPRCFCRTT